MFGRKRDVDDFAAEIEAHLRLESERLQEEGLSAEEARHTALRRFGNVTGAEERFFESSRWLWLDHAWQDVRYAARLLRKSPGFTIVAVLTMALGIGATTAIFSVVDATLLHPLPYAHPEQLVRIEDDLPGLGARDVGMSQPEWQDLQHSGIFDGVSPTWYDDNNLTGASRPARVSLLIVAPNYFSLFGVRPQIGRAFPPDDYTPSFTTEVVISDGLWKRSFGANPAIIGNSIRLDTDLYHVVGVMPPGFHDPGTTLRERNIEVWAATSFFGPPLFDQPPRSGRNLPTAIARIKPGLTVAEAQSRVDALVAALQKQFPGDYPAQNAWTVRLVPLKESVVGNVRQSLMLLLAAVGLVLLIGCVNLANLLLARASARGSEIAIRQALGGARARLIRQLLTESVLLSVLGGAAGLTLLYSAKGFLLRFLPESLPRFNDISINASVLLFAVAASVVTGAVFGLVPALHVDRVDVTRRLKQEGRGSTGSREQQRTRRLLIVTEFALSVVLMTAAVLLLRSFRELLNARLGFNPERVMAIQMRLPYPNDVKADLYGTTAQQAPFFREVLRRVRALPGVEDAAIGNLGAVPLAHDRSNQNPPIPMVREGKDTNATDAPLVDDSIVMPEYFHALGMTLVRGRLFDEFDSGTSPAVAVINEAMARTYWPAADPIGQRVKLFRRATTWTTVVGIIANARTESLEDASVPEVYLSLHQTQAKHLAIFLRGQFDIAAIPDQVREQVQSVDRTIPVFSAQMLDDAVALSLSPRRFSMEVVGLFALTALLLAALGIYGVISYTVSERTHEIGIRLALGAHHRNIVLMILQQGVAFTIAGTAAGLVGAMIVSHVMAGLLYGVRPTDPTTYAAVTILLAIVALVACYIPARRVLRVDPLTALRRE
ncbi:MAG TPA: ABC transporter permease [Vicinamibacterales bacterium]